MPQISDAILNAVQRGVKVRMIADFSNIGSTGSQVNRLQENGKYTTREMCGSIENTMAINTCYLGIF